MIKSLPKNTLGRDVFIGDLHGSYDLLMKMLENISFSSTDRLISVGDLINKGTDSFKCLSLINEPFFHFVRGNHEQMLIDAYEELFKGEYFKASSLLNRNGGNWAHEYMSNILNKRTSKETEQFVGLVEKLSISPFVLNIQNKKKIHVIHGEIPVCQPFKKYQLTDDLFEQQAFVSLYSTEILWCRKIFGKINTDNPMRFDKIKKVVSYNKFEDIFSDDFGLIISGHTIQKTPVLVGKQLNIDTGAWFSKKKSSHSLTCAIIFPDESIELFSQNEKFQKVEILNGNKNTMFP